MKWNKHGSASIHSNLTQKEVQTLLQQRRLYPRVDATKIRRFSRQLLGKVYARYRKNYIQNNVKLAQNIEQEYLKKIKVGHRAKIL